MERRMDNERFRLTTSPASGIRASDADRERTLELLRAHHLEGRLDASEFQERLERSLRAKTLGELHALSVDLPQEDPGQARGEIVGFRRPAAWRLAIAATVLAALIVASVFAERPLFFAALPLLFFWSRGSWWYGGWYRRTVIGGPDARVRR
jgi:hypothetical protein